MTLNEVQSWASIASSLFTIAGVVIAICVYKKNTRDQARQRSIDNATRYLTAHNKVFEVGSYLRTVVKDMEDGTYVRDIENKDLELKFNRFLGDMESIALLQIAGAVPKTINAYMLGWFCKKIYPTITDSEKANPYWQLAIDFIEETKKEAEALDGYSRSKKMEYLKRNHFS